MWIPFLSVRLDAALDAALRAGSDPWTEARGQT
jgi:hypothetical protein